MSRLLDLYVRSGGRPGDRAIADALVAAYDRAEALYSIHVSRCRARLAGERCERCLQLQAAEIEAERALEGR